MKKNKLIKILASITAMGAIGTGTAISVSSCGTSADDLPAIDGITSINLGNNPNHTLHQVYTTDKKGCN
jgi:hypothetical protein